MFWAFNYNKVMIKSQQLNANTMGEISASSPTYPAIPNALPRTHCCFPVSLHEFTIHCSTQKKSHNMFLIYVCK